MVRNCKRNSGCVILRYRAVLYAGSIPVLRRSGGGETFYYPPTTQMNGVNMPLVWSYYSNAFDDGFAASMSSISVRRGDAATITWTASSSTGAVYEVLGFRDLAGSIGNTAVSTNLSSNNSGIASTTTVTTTSKSKVVYLAFTTTGNPGLDVYNNIGGWGVGWDYSPNTPSATYNLGDRLRVLTAFELNIG